MAVTVKSLMERYELTDEECSKQVSDKHLEELSRTHCSKWRRLPVHLDLDTIVQEDIDCIAIAEDDKRYKFFKEWKERIGNAATYKTLVAALLKIDCRNDAEYVCDLLQSYSLRVRGLVLETSMETDAPTDATILTPATSSTADNITEIEPFTIISNPSDLAGKAIKTVYYSGKLSPFTRQGYHI